MSKKLSFIPQASQAYINAARSVIEPQLVALQDYMAEHGEGYAELQEYVKRGADYKIKEREAECRAHMDNLGLPSYLRTNQMQLAVADLGEDNLTYWRGLPSLMSIKTEKIQAFPISVGVLDVLDASENKWKLKETWLKAESDKRTITLPDFMAQDVAELTKVLDGIALLNERGYNIERAVNNASYCKQHCKVDLEDFYFSYNCNDDCRKIE